MLISRVPYRHAYVYTREHGHEEIEFPQLSKLNDKIYVP
jgi:hypothetical protein